LAFNLGGIIDMAILTGSKDEVINLATQMICSGQVVAIPTETVYGLGGNIAIDSSIKDIYKLKNRPINHPLIIHISDIGQLYEYATQVPRYVEFLAHKFWPGPLTFILPKSNKVSDFVTGGQDTVAIRMPNNDLTRGLIRAVGHPLAAPSANRFGKVSPTRPEHVIAEFNNDINVIDGGICNIRIESTIINAISTDGYTILRPGAITQIDLEMALKRDFSEIRLINNKISNKISFPGNYTSHYSPTKTLIGFNDSCGLYSLIKEYKDVYIIHRSNFSIQENYNTFKIGSTPSEFAKSVYHALRLGDNSSCQIIAIELPPNEIEWYAILDRLNKSVTKNARLPIKIGLN